MKKLLSVLAVCSLTTAVVGTSLAGTPTSRAAHVGALTTRAPAVIQLGSGPTTAAFPLVAGAFLLGAAIAAAAEEYFHHHGDCLTTTIDPGLLASDAVFDVAKGAM